MKGIYVERQKNGSLSYRAHFQNNGKLYRKRFTNENDAKEWLDVQKSRHPKTLKNSKRFSDLYYSGIKNSYNQKLYMAFDSKLNVWRLVTTSQIKNESEINQGGTIYKNIRGTYDLYIKKEGKKYSIGVYESKQEAEKKRNEIRQQIALGKPIQLRAKNSTGYKYISKRNDEKDKKYRFRLDKKEYKVCKYFYTLQEALDFREKYFKENGLEMPKDYIELNFN